MTVGNFIEVFNSAGECFLVNMDLVICISPATDQKYYSIKLSDKTELSYIRTPEYIMLKKGLTGMAVRSLVSLTLPENQR